MGREMAADVIRKCGHATYDAAVQSVWKRAEAKVRAAILAAPDGEYKASSFLDDDGINFGQTVPVRVAVHIKGDSITVDFSGVSPQLAGPLNAGRNGGAVAAARVAVKYLFSPEDPVNEGDFVALRVEIPDGTFLSASPNAPIALSLVGASYMAIASIRDPRRRMEARPLAYIAHARRALSLEPPAAAGR